MHRVKIPTREGGAHWRPCEVSVPRGCQKDWRIPAGFPEEVGFQPNLAKVSHGAPVKRSRHLGLCPGCASNRLGDTLGLLLLASFPAAAKLGELDQIHSEADSPWSEDESQQEQLLLLLQHFIIPSGMAEELRWLFLSTELLLRSCQLPAPSPSPSQHSLPPALGALIIWGSLVPRTQGWV